VDERSVVEEETLHGRRSAPAAPCSTPSAAASIATCGVDRHDKGLGMDTARDNVYTEWDEVSQFAEDFVWGLVPRNVGRTASKNVSVRWPGGSVG
jgi:hypothetical protein